ncbi:MAG: DUF5989 family protein [Alphaproteobacteria bacterium]|nr:DUF5989 family protein [Alphaproteobacteria bacterium]MDP7222678.1 DUF5989 family protein [Alphaproteobacteria bacterium]
MSIFMELLRFVHARKKYWMIPILFLFVSLGGLLILVKGSVVAPFIYTIF